MRQSPLLLPLVALLGCSADAPPPNEVRTRIASDLVAVSDAAKASTADGQAFPDTTNFSLLQTALGSSFDGVLATSNSSVSFLRSKMSRLTDIVAPRAKTSTRLPATGDAYDGTSNAQWLNDNLFTDANYAGDGIYNVPASLACADDTGAIDPDCANAWGKIQLRIRVFEDDDLLKFALQIGPSHDEPLIVGLSSTVLQVTVDLDEAEHAARALAAKFNGQLPNFSLDGRVTGRLEIPAANTAKISFNIDKSVSVRFADNGVDLDGPDAFRFTSGAAHVFSLALDGNAKSMESSLGLGHTSAHVPSDVDGTVDLDLPGLNGTATYAEGQSLKVTGAGLGDGALTVKIDGQLGASVEINPNNGHKLDLELAGDTLTVSPRLDFHALANHTILGDDAPVYDVTRIQLDGGLRGHTDAIEVTGALSIETNPASFGITAAAGQCVRGVDTTDSTGRTYSQLSVGACQ